MGRIPHAIYVREFIRDTPSHRSVLRQARMTLAVSKDLCRYLASFGSADRLAVAYDHLDLEPLLSRLRRHQASGTRLVPFGSEHSVVGCVGRLTSYKQQDLFIKSIPFVLKAVPAARFVVVGAPSEKERDYEARLLALTKELGVMAQVAFMGHRPDALEIMSELSVCCLTSDREPFPRTILEAQLAGCPVVASDTGGCPEMIENGANGLLFPVNSPAADRELSTQIIRILNDRDFARGAANRARQSIATGFGSLKPVRDFEASLASMMKNDGT
jgi:glycosyltransferase involved in cell wall biosynthesis